MTKRITKWSQQGSKPVSKQPQNIHKNGYKTVSKTAFKTKKPYKTNTTRSRDRLDNGYEAVAQRSPTGQNGLQDGYNTVTKKNSQETEATGEGVTPPGSTAPTGDGVSQLPPLLIFSGAPVHVAAGLGVAVTT